jgi:hypothetical protein
MAMIHVVVCPSPRTEGNFGFVRDSVETFSQPCLRKRMSPVPTRRSRSPASVLVGTILALSNRPITVVSFGEVVLHFAASLLSLTVKKKWIS